jgi:hypothetical protein
MLGTTRASAEGKGDEITELSEAIYPVCYIMDSIWSMPPFSVTSGGTLPFAIHGVGRDGLDTLTVEHLVGPADRLPPGSDDIALAGGLIWVTGTHSLTAVNPATARLTATVPLPAAASTGGFTAVAAGPGGASLWTSQGSSGGGPIAVQRRNPRTGAVLAAARGPQTGIGGTRIAAAGNHAWLAYATGMLGGYFKASVPPAGPPGLLRETRPGPSPAGRTAFSNAASIYLAGQMLWILDNTSISCATDATGQILAQTRDPGAGFAALAPLPRGRLALLLSGSIFIVRPTPPCRP